MANKQKKYDVDFKRLEKLSIEPYAYYIDLFLKDVLPMLKNIPAAVTVDADQIDQDELKRKLDLIAAQAQTSFNLNRLAAMAKSVFQNMKVKSEKAFFDEMKKRMGVAFNKRKLSEAIKGEVTDRIAMQILNAGKSMDDISLRSSRLYGEDQWTKQQQQIQGVTNRVLSGVSAGERWESISKAIIGSADAKSGDQVLKKAAKEGDSMARKMINQSKFIARNAASSVVGAYDKELATTSGGAYYMWQTSEDERVRPTHNDLNGKVFAWNPGQKAVADISYSGSNYSKGQTIPQAKDPSYNSGSATYPGQPWNCRCVAINLIPGIDY